MIYLYCDSLGSYGGIESYLYSLSLTLLQKRIPFKIYAAELQKSPLIDELIGLGADVYRQPRIYGDTWHMRQRALNLRLSFSLRRGDWVYCVRQPIFDLYPEFAKMVHSREAKLAVSWMLSPEYLRPEPGKEYDLLCALNNTDLMFSVAKCSAGQFKTIYGFDGKVHILRYHNIDRFSEPVPLPEHPPWKIGYIGRISIHHKNLDGLVNTFALLKNKRPDTELHIYGSGGDSDKLSSIISGAGLDGAVVQHGHYDNRTDLPKIMSSCHIFVYPSRMEGGPCQSILEILQAGRFCVTSPAGGIPDVYAGHPECGTMIEPDDTHSMAGAIENAINVCEKGQLRPDIIRSRYLTEFANEHAQKAFMEYLK